MRKCCVRGCKSGPAMHSFPKNDPEAFLIWRLRSGNPELELDQLTDNEIHSKYLMCSLHFESICFTYDIKRKMLNHRSLPTINVPGFVGPSTAENALLSDNTKQLKILNGWDLVKSEEVKPKKSSDSQHLYQGHCCVINCPGRLQRGAKKRGSFYRFPVSDPERCAKWVEFCRNKALDSIDPERLRHYGICPRHFSKRYICSTDMFRCHLMRSAIPTLFDPRPDHQIEDDFVDPREQKAAQSVASESSEPTAVDQPNEPPSLEETEPVPGTSQKPTRPVKRVPIEELKPIERWPIRKAPQFTDRGSYLIQDSPWSYVYVDSALDQLPADKLQANLKTTSDQIDATNPFSVENERPNKRAKTNAAIQTNESLLSRFSIVKCTQTPVDWSTFDITPEQRDRSVVYPSKRTVAVQGSGVVTDSEQECSVPGCRNRHYFMLSIPWDEKIRKIWLTRIGDPILTLTFLINPDHQASICQDHFISENFNGKELLPFSLPTKNLRKFHETPSLSNAFSQNWIHRIQSDAVKMELDDELQVPNVTYMDLTGESQKRKNEELYTQLPELVTYQPESCSAVGCKSNSHSDKLFRAPSNVNRLKVWKEISELPDTQPVQFLCSKHFDASQFTSMLRLVKGSDPRYKTGLTNPITRNYKPLHPLADFDVDEDPLHEFKLDENDLGWGAVDLEVEPETFVIRLKATSTKMCGMSIGGTSKLSEQIKAGLRGCDIGSATHFVEEETDPKDIHQLISEKSLMAILQADVEDLTCYKNSTVSQDEELRMLRRQVESRWTPPPVESVINRSLLGLPVSFELYRSLRSKKDLLRAAIKSGDGDTILSVVLFLNKTLKRKLFADVIGEFPVAVNTYISYLSIRKQTNELVDLLEMRGRSRDAAMVLFAESSSNPGRMLARLKSCYRSHFVDSRDSTIVQNFVKLVEWQENYFDRTLIGASVASCLSAISQSAQSVNPELNAKTFAATHSVSTKLFQWTALNARAKAKAWRDLDLILISKNWLGTRKFNSELPLEHILKRLHELEVPEDILTTYLDFIDDPEKRLDVAKSLNCSKVVLDTYAQLRDRLGIISYKANFPPQTDLFLYAESVLRRTVSTARERKEGARSSVLLERNGRDPSGEGLFGS